MSRAGVTVTLRPASPWRHAAIILGSCLVLLCIVHRATIGSIVGAWSHDPFGHGYLVVPAVLYLAAAQRGRLDATGPIPSSASLALIAILSALWLLANLAFIVVVQQLCVIAIVAAITWAVIGSSGMRAMAFPLGLLVFALPMGDRVAPLLQALTARFAASALAISRVPAVLEAQWIIVPGTRWHVSEACGGVNYVVASVTVAYVYAGMVYGEWRHRAGLLVAAVLVALAGNGIRVYTTILLDYLGATRVASGMTHEVYGWIVFAIVMIVLFSTCGRWREEPRSAAAASPRQPSPDARSMRQRTRLVAVAAMLLVIAAPMSAALLDPSSRLEDPLAGEGPHVSLPWTSTDASATSWPARLVVPMSRFLRNQSYASDGDRVTLLVAPYGPAAEPAADEDADEALWWIADERRHTVMLDGQPVDVDELRLASGGPSLLVWRWHGVDGRFTGNRYLAKLLLARARLVRAPGRAAVFAVATEERPGIDAAAVLARFIAQLSFLPLPDARLTTP
jgi:exosortase A